MRLLVSLILAKYDKLAKLKVCHNCVHFTQNYNYVAEHGCKKYSQQNLINGKMVNGKLPDCRESSEMCSIEGKDFELMKFAYLRNLKLKVYAHFWNKRSEYEILAFMSRLIVLFGGMGLIGIGILKLYIDADIKSKERK